MFGKKSKLTKISCDVLPKEGQEIGKNFVVTVQENSRGGIIDMNPRVNDALNVFAGQQMSEAKAIEIQEYINFQLNDVTDINGNWIKPTVIWQKQPK